MSKHIAYPIVFGYIVLILPVITMHLCFIVSVAEGHIELCNPYWVDCVSVSKTGRSGAAYFIFKGGMVSTSALLFITWQLIRYWLATIGQPRHKSLFWLPAISSISLLLYSLALGHTGDSFYLMRRTGVVLFMFCGFISQVIVGQALRLSLGLADSGQKLLVFSAVTLAIAIFSLVLDMLTGDKYERIENAFEWWLIMLLICHSLLTIRLWRGKSFILTFFYQGCSYNSN